jgi:hypothetical protein
MMMMMETTKDKWNSSLSADDGDDDGWRW